MINIKKHGVFNNKKLKFECKCCGCIVESDEYNFSSCISILNYPIYKVSISCPECESEMTKTVNNKLEDFWSSNDVITFFVTFIMGLLTLGVFLSFK